MSTEEQGQLILLAIIIFFVVVYALFCGEPRDEFLRNLGPELR